MKKKLFLVVALVFVALFAFAACAPQSKPVEAPSSAATSGAEVEAEKVVDEVVDEKAPAEQVGGVLSISYSGTPQPHEKEFIINEFFKGFEEETGAKVEVDFIAQADAIKKISTEQETGNFVTDIIYADTANMAPYINGDWMEDISAIIDGSGSTYTKMYDESTNKDGKRYFVPNAFDVYITIANIKALEYLPEGVTQEMVEQGITWEQYAQWAINIAKGEGQGKAMMPASMEGSQLLYPMGGMSLAYGGNFPELNSEGFKSSLEITASMAEADAFYAEQDQYSAPTDPLNSGDVWLTFAHMAPAGASYSAAPNNFVIGSAPKGSAGKGSTSGAWCYGIPKGAPNKALAEKFIEYITRPEVNYNFCINFGGALSPIEEVGELLEDGDVIMKAGLAMLNDTKITGVPATQYSDWNAVKLLYGDVFKETLKGTVPSAEYLNEAQKKLEALKLPAEG